MATFNHGFAIAFSSPHFTSECAVVHKCPSEVSSINNNRKAILYEGSHNSVCCSGSVGNHTILCMQISESKTKHKIVKLPFNAS